MRAKVGETVSEHVPKAVWKMLQNQSEQSLGSEFWQEIAQIMPNQGPRYDLYEIDGNYAIIMELPGLSDAGRLQLTVQGKTLHVRGDIAGEYPVAEEELLHAERFTGPFHRRIEVPREILANSATAEYGNGLLRIYLTIKPEEPEQPVSIAFRRG